MNCKKEKNSGFTLIELIIAIAMLAFIMTAVSALMGSSILSFKKTKAGISVQNQAQATYDRLTDSVMQAKNIVIYGYEASGDIDFSGKIGATTTKTVTPYYYVKSKAEKDALNAAGTTNVKLFKDLASFNSTTGKTEYKKIYVISMQMDIATDIPFGFGTFSVDNALTGEHETVKYDATSKTYDKDDICRTKYTFEENCLYEERLYAYSTGVDYQINPMNAESKKYAQYSNSFNYVKSGSDTVSGCVATVDSANGSIGLDLYFKDRNLKYDTLGMIKVRNSYVLKDKK